MNSIRQIADFVHLDAENFQPLAPVLSLKNLSRWTINAPVVSMRQVIGALENLPEVVWQPVLSALSGTAPFTISITVNTSGGIRSDNRLFKDGQDITFTPEHPNGPFYFKTGPANIYYVDLPSPGTYKIVLNREYLDRHGYHNVTSEYEVIAKAPAPPQPSTLALTMRVVSNTGIFIDQAAFTVHGPGAPQQPVNATSQLGQFFATIQLPKPPAGQTNKYSVQAAAVYHTNEFGIGQPLQSVPTTINLSDKNTGMLFNLGFIPETNQFYLVWTGNI